MIKLGDIVTPEDCCWGHGYLFRVSSLVRTMGCESKYKLQRIEEQALDLRKGPSREQLAIIQQVEDSLWGENALQVLEPTPETAVKMKNKNLSDICVQGNPEGITIRGDSFQTILSDEIIKWPTVSIDSSLSVFQGGKKIYTINKKEEKEMDILDLYKERKKQLLMNNFYKERQEIIEEDEIQKIKNEMINQINIILDNEERNEKFETLVPGIAKNVFTKQTQEKINKLELDLNLEKDKLYNTIQEVKALFEMTDSYEERIKILKKYDILDKNGKLSV